MTNIAVIRYMISGEVFDEIKYDDINDLCHELKLMIIKHDTDILMTLLIDDKILNDFDVIDTSILSLLNEDNCIMVIFSDKKLLYCLNNHNGKYILDNKKNDDYSNIVIVRYMISGEVFDEIKYDDINDLCHELKLMIIKHDTDILMTLLIDDKILNDFDVIDTSILSLLNEDNCIMVIFSDKKLLYCLNNYNGKYILDNKKSDDYSKLLESIIYFYEDRSYYIIMNSSYKDLVLHVVIEDGEDLEYVNITLQDDKEVVLKAVEQYGKALKYASTNLQDDKEVIFEAIKQNVDSLKFASIDLQNNKEVILEIVKQYGIALQHTNFINDKEVVLIAVKQNGLALQYTHYNLQNDEEIVLVAIRQTGEALKYANTKFYDNKKIILESVKTFCHGLKFASIELQNDKEIVLEAIKYNRYALRYANINFRDDKDIILAINIYGYEEALRYIKILN